MPDLTTDTPTTTPTPAPRLVHRIFTATLILGVPGSGKTSLFKGFAEYLWETYKQVLLLYSTDGGAIPTDVQKRMKQGLIRFWRMRTRSAPGLGLETLYLASKGYWPRYINAENGETSPAVQLVPPVTVSYKVSCPKGHPMSVVPSPSLIVPMMCTPCNQFIGMPDLRVEETSVRTRGFELVGGVGFDGLTSFTDGVLDHMDLQRGEGNIGGEKAAFGGVVVSGSQKFGGNNRADVGFGQSRGHQFVNNSLSIPYLREGPVWTALAMEATDEGGLPIVGPKLPGRAATDEASAWFGNVAETGKSPDDAGRSCFTLWLRPYVDAQNRRHLLKTSASPTGVPDLLRDPPEEAKQPYTVVNLGSVFRMLDEDLRRSLLEEIPDAPGTPSGLMEYGEALTVQSAASPAGPVSGIPPLTAPTTTGVAPVPLQTPLATPQAGTPVAPQGLPASGGVPLMVAKPRTKRGAGTIAQVAPPPPTTPPVTVAPVAEAAPVPSPQPVAPTVVQTVPVSTAATPVMAPPVGTTPPPPPGMRPPMKAPGS